ncbi:PP2C family serine/threonine-protein phosphatase [Actinomadura sp. HBU206391]|uniref:PP2C family serine/threonine-protein phosphatase n=1 Tax=Actinomadura sp. HBU206391 TaxID=2731692 RepID=UPI001650C271|nr:protein phosphatase 2C domain-containing protein [Actinomadura sp. HBU206391]MBC6460809.1 protein phosphatase 2C domain-containing protein [Actinomadura sp. HBU206391]
METSTGAPAAGDQADCPACGYRVHLGDGFCEACGQRLGARRCGECGAAALGPDGYCERCGVRGPGPRDHVEIELPAADGMRHIAPAIAGGVSDRGLRHRRNEDAMALAAYADGVLAVVCDGVSASPRPHDASQAAADAGAAVLAEQITSGADPEQATLAAVTAAAEAVAALAGPDGAPACTYVSGIVDGRQITVGWVGDSRAYWLTDGKSADDAHALASAVLTTDDSLATAMVVRGLMSEAEAQASPKAHVLTGWLGADADELDAHVAGFVPDGPGVVLICSDGLWNYLPATGDLAAALSETHPPDELPPGGVADAPLTAARSLVGTALDAGGRDNVTVVVIPFPPPPRPNGQLTAEPPK